MLKIKHFLAFSMILSAATTVFSSKSAQANYCSLPTNLDPAWVLCQAQNVNDELRSEIDAATPEAQERQQYLQDLYNYCMAGYSEACAEYDYEMERQLEHMDNVIDDYEQYSQ